jgi:hypothetical protein
MGFANKRASAQSRWPSKQLAMVVCLIVVALLLTQQQLLLTHSGGAVAERSTPSPQPGWDLEKAVREYTAVFPDYPLPLYGANDDNLCEISAGAAPLRIAIFVFAWRRVRSLRRTLASLLAAEYCGATLSLTILFDAQPSEAAVAVAESIAWRHGPFRIVIEPSPNGVRNMWVRVLSRELEREPPEAHVLPIEDDNEVSPLFYWWLRRAADAYGPFDSPEGARRFRHLAGVSLYSPRHNEIKYPMQWWWPRSSSAAGQSPAYLFQLPCSWGALFFRAHWRRFGQFYRVRTRAPFFNFSHEALQRGQHEQREVLGDPALAIPESRASTWPRSWKRFLIDYMYGRGDVMLYPSAPVDVFHRRGSVSFATTYMERGDHSGTDARVEDNVGDTLRPNADLDTRKTVPLLQRKHASMALSGLRHLPTFDKLPVIGLNHRRISSLAKLEAMGRQFVESRPAYSSAWQRARLGQAVEHTVKLDPRPAVQDRGSRAPTTAEYTELARVWLCAPEDSSTCGEGDRSDVDTYRRQFTTN